MSETTHIAPRTRKPRGQGASRRGEILAAASRIFLKGGIAGATMRRIAEAVGVSPTALYVYYPDKDAILQAIAEATFADLLEALEASQETGLDGPARFRAGLEAYVAFGLANPGPYRLTFLSSPAQRGAKPCDSIQAADHSFAILQHGVEEMIAAAMFRAGPQRRSQRRSGQRCMASHLCCWIRRNTLPRRRMSWFGGCWIW